MRPLVYSNDAASDTGIEIPTVLDITVETESGISYEIPEAYEKAGETLQVIDDFVVVNSTDNLMAMYPFHQEKQYIVEGRSFTDEEYISGERVIVISDLVAARLGKTVGDELKLAFIPPDESGSAPNYWAGNGFTNQSDFTIVGITNSVDENEWYVYIPKRLVRRFRWIPLGIRSVRQS